MGRTCIFCGQTANSVEDAWPLWLTERFIASGSMEAQIGIDAPPRTWRVKRPELRIKRVCRKCNNGWMSQLEKRAKPVITRLLDHNACTLDIQDCKTLSLWALKTSMVLESVNNLKHWIYTELERCLLFNRDQIPAFTNVWIAKCVNSPSAYTISRNLSIANDQTRAAVTTLAFGSLAIQVRKVVPPAMTHPETTITVEQRPGSWEKVVLEVWPPPMLVRWPAPMGLLDEHGLETLAERFSPAGSESEDVQESDDLGLDAI